ncbi:sulfurtransferase TusA family protein [Vibrio sp. MarTm2]|uniref:sulfurtransferase TusA family protein n=1 Tax=Vibrio sp. MarTm2 TaxID=2998831 RepID=UPI0022CD797D|nr:sulfurtransferase TusA family protein [Vibrio sp. MarTm2]MDA0126938.1 sulfurtransferase TusA family protein [Vibrio sp. MarTm2]
MEPNILDLRQERCPLALLLAKRHTNLLKVGDSCCILIRESSSKSDIQKFLQKQHFDLLIEEMDDHFRIHVNRTKEMC